MDSTQKDYTQVVQGVAGTLAHHINSALMTALLEFDTIQQQIALQETPDPRIAIALERITYSLERIDRVIRTAQQVDNLPDENYRALIEALDLRLSLAPGDDEIELTEEDDEF